MLYGYALVMECLNAQLQVIQLKDKSEFSAEELNTICRDAEDIISRMNFATSVIFGETQLVESKLKTIWFTDTEPEQREGRTIEKILYSEYGLIPPDCPAGQEHPFRHDLSGYASCYGYKVTDITTNTIERLPEDSLTGMHEDFDAMYDLTYINKGTADIEVSPDLSSRKISTWGTETLKRIVDEQPIKAADINNLVKYAAGKGMSLVDFLKSVGFNTDNLPSSVLMPTGDVWNDHNTFDDINCIIKKINDDWDYVNSDYRNTYIIGFQYR